jgi:1,4-dihydroxy-2-naphthoate octaprenyltransferase
VAKADGAPPAPKPLPEGWKIWVAGARPRTLPAAIVPVLVGTAAAAGVIPNLGDGGWYMFTLDTIPGAQPLKGIILWRMAAAMIVALAIQIATNFANDYSDGKRGTDDPGKRVGPPRLVGWGLASPSAVKRAVIVSFGVAAVAGLTLAYAVGWWLILVGLVCFAAGWFYTGGPRPYGYAGLGEVFVFAFFGIVATAGSAYVQVGSFAGADLSPPPGVNSRGMVLSSTTNFSLVLFGVAAAVGCLATALLVINNLRDIPSDTESGKRTLAVKLGDKRTRLLYVVLIVLPFVIIPVVCGLGGRPLGAMALFAIVFANQPVLQVLQGAKGPALIPVLGQTGRLQLVFGILLSVGLFLSA